MSKPEKMINFDNTEIAFQGKTTLQLRKASFLFNAMSSQGLVKVGSSLLQKGYAWHLPLDLTMKSTIYAQFCGGESLIQCEPVVRDLEKYNIKAILDYSVEGSETVQSMQAAFEETLMAISHAGADHNIAFAVFKPTAFINKTVLIKASYGSTYLKDDEKQEIADFRSRVNTLASHAASLNIPLMIDAEDTYYQNFIDQVVTEMMQQYNTEKVIIYNTLQTYRHDRLQFLADALNKAIAGNYKMGIKLVRGAYMEKERERANQLCYPSPIFDTKEETDIDYDAAVAFCVEHIDRISLFNGTHNQHSCELLVQLMQDKGLQPNDNRIYFAQLYGMSDNLSYNLAAEGYNVAKYLPYGPVKQVIPYLIRRAEENTAVAGQSNRELNLIQTEIKRRKNKK